MARSRDATRRVWCRGENDFFPEDEFTVRDGERIHDVTPPHRALDGMSVSSGEGPAGPIESLDAIEEPLEALEEE
jgi:hypothetical protein